MKIGIVASSHNPLPSPPDKIWAPGVNITRLSEGLSQRGHDVFVFAANDSQLPENQNLTLVDCGLPSITLAYPGLRETNFARFTELFAMHDLALISKAVIWANNNKLDLVHFHDIRRSIFFAPLISKPVVYTFRSNFLPEYEKWLESISDQLPVDKITVTALSYQHREQFLPYFKNVEVVYNGVELNKFAFSESSSSRYLFSGRIVADKGVREAAEIAVKAGIELDILGSIGDTDNDRAYFRELTDYLAKHSNVNYLGLKPWRDMPAMYAQAKALIFPLNWKEPFGMVIAESMACGTPIIAYDSGSISELVEDKVTGFVVKSGDKEGIVAAVKKVEAMTPAQYLQMRKKCRERVENNFSLSRTIDGYLKIYDKITRK